jgi:hypothetical protein
VFEDRDLADQAVAAVEKQLHAQDEHGSPKQEILDSGKAA